MIKDFLLSKAYAADDISLKTLFGDGSTMPGADFDTVMTIIDQVMKIALEVAAMIGIIMILYSGFIYVTSFGEESKAETAKKTLLWSMIGTIVVSVAWVIVNLVDQALGG